MPDNGDRPITPMEIPPLVASHLEWVRPTSRNKMFNARIAYRNFGDKWSEHRRVAQVVDDKRHNQGLFRGLLGLTALQELSLQGDARRVTALGAVHSHQPVREVLGRYRWADGDPDLQRELEFLDGENGDPELDDWLVLLPQLTRPNVDWTWKVEGREVSIHHRGFWNDSRPLVNAYSGPDDRAIAEVVTGKRTAERHSEDLARQRQSRRGVMLVYPITHETRRSADWIPTIGFSLLFPRNRIRRLIGFTVARASEAGEPVVDAS